MRAFRPTAHRLHVAGLLLLLAGTSVSACAAPTDETTEAGDAVSEAAATAVLDLHPLDIWAQPLEARTVTITRDGQPVAPVETGAPKRLRVLLGRPATYAIRVASPDHVTLDLTVAYDGQGIEVQDASLAPDGGRAGVTVAHAERRLRTRTLPGHDLVVGLRHAWFSAQGRPARRGNAVALLMNGEEAWRNVHARLLASRTSVLASTWWWDSSFELVRDNPLAPASERARNTILSTLEASPAQKRVLVGQFLGNVSLLSWMTSDSGLRSHANDPSFQFMREGNDARGKIRFEIAPVSFGERVKQSGAFPPEAAVDPDAPIPSTVPPHDVDLSMVGMNLVDHASVHQKFTVVDGSTAYIGGMNLREADWDSSEHKPFDARRLPFDATDAQRAATASGVCDPSLMDQITFTCSPPSPGPRKDYMLRIDGPAVTDAIDVFERRWNNLVASGASDAAGRSLMGELEGDRSPKGGVTVQVTATMPAPYNEHAIAETWFNAVRNAEHFVYIEDQYFRIPMMHEALAKRMDERPDLKLVVVTKPVSRMDPGCAQTRAGHDFFAQRYPERFAYLTLNSFEPTLGRLQSYVPIDIHAKMLVVDDVFMSVGSANKNNRGLVYEYELNAAVHDRAFVTASRRRMLQALAPDVPETDDSSVWFAHIKATAEENGRRLKANQDTTRAVVPPNGFYYPLTVPTGCALPLVGPDTT